MREMLRKLVRSDEGQDLIEYGLLVGIITIGAIVAINADRTEGEDLFRRTSTRRCHRESDRLRFPTGGKRATPMKTLAKRLWSSTEGQDLIEYGLLIGIITLASVIAMTAIGGKVKAYFTNLNAAMP